MILARVSASIPAVKWITWRQYVKRRMSDPNPSKSILIADTDVSQRRRLASEFQVLGFTVHECGSVADVEFASLQLDFAVIDAAFLTVADRDVLFELGSQNLFPRIAVVSASPTFQMALDAGKRGANSFLRKPLSAESILHSLECSGMNDVVSSEGPLVEEPLREGEAGAGTRSPVVSLEVSMREQLQQALVTCGGNITRTAHALGISRRTVHRKLKDFPELRRKSRDPGGYEDC